MAKKSNTPLEVVKGETAPKKEDTTAQAAKFSNTEANEPTKEELLKKVATLEKKAFDYSAKFR